MPNVKAQTRQVGNVGGLAAHRDTNEIQPRRRRRRGRRTFVVIFALMILAAANGCGKHKARPRRYPVQVRGTVTLEEKPLSSGTITFIPEMRESNGGRVGIGRIESGGEYWIGNANPGKPSGLIPGRYRVTILSMVPDPMQTGDPIAQLAVPEHYTDMRSTPFQVEIAAGDRTLDFKLTR